MRRYFSVAFLVLLCSHSVFATKLKGQSTPTQPTSITEGQAISIAERVIKEKNPRVKEIQPKARFKNDQWHIFAEFIMGYDKKGNPLGMVGGHCSIIIDKSGNVIEYHWGE
jgi:hypothetical protein